jgi:signal transduction histidine kinase
LSHVSLARLSTATTEVCYQRSVWILFVAIGAVMLAVLAYGWGLAKGSELTRAAQAKLHDAVRASAGTAVQSHERERGAWHAAELASQVYANNRGGGRDAVRELREQRDQAADAAEAAHEATRDAIETLRAALVDPSQPDALEQARRLSERRAEEAAKRKSEREQRNSVEDEEANRLLS